MKTRPKSAVLNPLSAAVLLLASALGLARAQTPSPGNGSFSDDFSSYGTVSCLPANGQTLGAWTVGFAGYGCISVGRDASGSYLETHPNPPAAPPEYGQNAAGLMLGPVFNQPSTYQVTIKTVAQLRTNAPVSPWEVGWFLWDYTDDNHFYSFQVQPNGWNLAKEDPAYPGAQRFLTSGPMPQAPIGGAYTVKIVQTSANSVSIYVNGSLVTSYTDTQSPYTHGRIGLYSEASAARYQNVSVTPTSAPSAGGGSTGGSGSSGAPVALSALNPASVTAGGPAFNLWLTGSGFTAGSVVQLNGVNVPTSYQGPTSVGAYVPPQSIASAGAAKVTVATPGAGVSNPLSLAINGAAAAPAVASISPASVQAGGPAFNLWVTGSGFSAGSVVQLNGVNVPTSYQGPTSVGAYVPPQSIASAGTAKVTVTTPGAGTSGAASLAVAAAPTAAAPAIASLSPASAPARSAAFNLWVTGTGFTSGTVVQVNGANVPTSVKGPTSIVSYVSAQQIAAAGTLRVTVSTPGAPASNAVSFVVTAPKQS